MGLPEGNAQVLADLLGKRHVGVSGKYSYFFEHRKSFTQSQLAGAGGFEPPNAGSKFLCLTA